MNAHTPCAHQGCAVTALDEPLYRVNPKGEKGIFMCSRHAAEIDAPPKEPT